MRTFTFLRRTAKEILLDPLTVLMGLGFPLVVLLLLTAIQRNIPVKMFELIELTPGISVFGLSFITLFSALLVSKDRTTSFLQRLFTTPLTASDYILGYTLPLIPISLLQSAVCYLAAVILGLEITVGIIWALLSVIVISLFFIALGLFFGSILTDKQVGGLCGALVTNLTAWLSGTWFDVSMVGGWFETIANILPFIHCVELQRALLKSDFDGIFPHLWFVLGYAALFMIAAVIVFTRKMKSD